MYIVSENKYIFDGEQMKPRGWRDIAAFNTLEEARKYYRLFCYGYMGHLVHFHSWVTASRFFTNPSRKREFEAYGARVAT